MYSSITEPVPTVDAPGLPKRDAFTMDTWHQNIYYPPHDASGSEYCGDMAIAVADGIVVADSRGRLPVWQERSVGREHRWPGQQARITIQESQHADLLTNLWPDTATMTDTYQSNTRDDRRIRSLFASLPIPIIITEAHGRILTVNQVAVDLLGRREQLLGQRLEDVLPFLESENGLVGEGCVHAGALSDSGGNRVDLEVHCTVIPGDNPERATVHIIHDISRHAELSRLREQLLYDLAHELRGPLTVLDNALEILNTDYGELNADEFGQLVRGATRTAARLRRLMDDLLSAGSIQTGRFLVHRRPVPLHAIVSDAIDAAEPLARERLLHITYLLPEEPVTVLADRNSTGRVLLNLLNNAVKYSPKGASIQVRAERTGAMVWIAVEDHGPGISTEQQSGIFERFYRVRGRSEEPGVGLGLAIARGIVEAHGGTIGIQSAPGQGTTVWFTLPSASPAQGDPNQT